MRHHTRKYHARNYRTRRLRHSSNPFHFRKFKQYLVASDTIYPGERKHYKTPYTKKYKKGKPYYSQKIFNIPL